MNRFVKHGRSSAIGSDDDINKLVALLYYKSMNVDLLAVLAYKDFLPREFLLILEEADPLLKNRETFVKEVFRLSKKIKNNMKLYNYH
jgi:hypothetical protein